MSRLLTVIFERLFHKQYLIVYEIQSIEQAKTGNYERGSAVIEVFRFRRNWIGDVHDLVRHEGKLNVISIYRL